MMHFLPFAFYLPARETLIVTVDADQSRESGSMPHATNAMSNPTVLRVWTRSRFSRLFGALFLIFALESAVGLIVYSIYCISGLANGSATAQSIASAGIAPFAVMFATAVITWPAAFWALGYNRLAISKSTDSLELARVILGVKLSRRRHRASDVREVLVVNEGHNIFFMGGAIGALVVGGLQEAARASREKRGQLTQWVWAKTDTKKYLLVGPIRQDRTDAIASEITRALGIPWPSAMTVL